jgi:hypothetical protein
MVRLGAFYVLIGLAMTFQATDSGGTSGHCRRVGECLLSGEADIATRLPRLCECAVRKPDTLATLERNSLLRLRNSLFSEIFSLLICFGNCSKSHSSAVGFQPRNRLLEPQNREIPCKIPC